MTMDEAVEAGLLVGALRALPELIADCEAEASGPVDPPQTRWKLLCLEVWAKDHAEDSGQEKIGPEVALPPAFAARVLATVKDAIAARLGELGVVE